MPFGLSPQQLSYQRLCGLAFGSVFAATVAIGWIGILATLEQGRPRAVSVLVLLLVSFAALIRGLYLILKYRLPEGVKLPYMEKWSFWAKFYSVIAIETVAIYLLIGQLDVHQLKNGLFPLIVFVVGAHFYPLAILNGNKIWYITASVLCLGVIALVVTTRPQSTTNAFGTQSSIWALTSCALMIITMLATSIQSGQLFQQSSVKQP